MTIGERIKELRKKKDLTQEKVADFLCVSYQAVSKWECGLSSPDLALIIPLARLLGVTTDELLGATPVESDTQREALEAAYKKTFETGDIYDRIRVSEEAVRALPGDMRWLNRFAWDVWSNAIDTEINYPEAFEIEREKAIKLFDTVIQNTDEDGEKAHAVTGIVQCLCGKGQKDEARKYVELYPETKVDPFQKKHLLSMCMSGDEQLRFVQRCLHDKLYDLIEALVWDGLWDRATACAAAEGVLKAMIPDENYLDHHYAMSHVQFRKAELAAGAGRTDEALELLKDAMYHAEEYDRIDTGHPGVYTYTAPLFKGLTLDSRQWCHTGTGTLADDLAFMSRREVFDGLREHPAFLEIFG
ncbi:MAG: helix-turn-helix transcriptional regulator [Ruminococcaceae bacterium]|nr:helix-turn-helix transcriptional regulator [Oscillospiraceae bacterium]